MADKSLADLANQAIDRRTAALKDTAGLSAPEGQIPPMVRIIAQNIFDDQPKLKAQYLKQNGFELNPKDDNQYRPIGSGVDWGELDPGFKSAFAKGGIAGLFKELKQKGEDSVFNSFVSSPAIAAGGASGIISGPIGTILGGAAGSNAARALKTGIGETLLDERIAPDLKPFAINAMIDGFSNQALNAIGKKGGEALSGLINRRRDALANAMEATGNNLTKPLIKDIVESPEKFSKENVKGATEKISGIYRDIFGNSPGSVNRPEKLVTGELAKKINPLNEQAAAEVSKLAANPSANLAADELLAPLRQKVEALSAQTGKSIEDKAGLAYLKDKIGEIEDMGKKSFNYEEAKSILNSIQDDTFNREVSGRGAIAQAIGGGEDGLRTLLDTKATSAGSSLAQINAKRSEMLSTYKNLSEQLTPQNIQSAFVGQDSVKKEAVRNAAQQMDQVFETKLGQSIESGGMQKAVEGLYQTQSPAKAATGVGALDAVVNAGKSLKHEAGVSLGVSKPTAIDLVSQSQQAKDFAGYMAKPSSNLANVAKAEVSQAVASPIKQDLNNSQAAAGAKPVDDLDSQLLSGIQDSSVKEANPVDKKDPLDDMLLKGVSQ